MDFDSLEKQINYKDIKRLVVDVPYEFHEAIKLRAVKKNMSMKQWIIKALLKTIREEKIQDSKKGE